LLNDNLRNENELLEDANMEEEDELFEKDTNFIKAKLEQATESHIEDMIDIIDDRFKIEPDEIEISHKAVRKQASTIEEPNVEHINK
jgi:hypothetical protein